MRRAFLFLASFIFAICLFAQKSEQTPQDSKSYVQLQILKQEFLASSEHLEQLKAKREEFVQQGNAAQVKVLDEKIAAYEKIHRENAIRFTIAYENAKNEKNIEFFGDTSKISELEAKSRQLGQAFQTADASKQQQVLAELTIVVNQLFDLREEQKKEEIKQLQDRVEELNSTLKERQRHKKEIVQRRIDELTGKGGIYSWD